MQNEYSYWIKSVSANASRNIHCMTRSHCICMWTTWKRKVWWKIHIGLKVKNTSITVWGFCDFCLCIHKKYARRKSTCMHTLIGFKMCIGFKWFFVHEKLFFSSYVFFLTSIKSMKTHYVVTLFCHAYSFVQAKGFIQTNK